ncbi:DUF3168 domain-containing protein [Labrenzia sp. ac12]
MAEANVIGALVEALKADSIVAALTADRVFGGELPKDETRHMPRHAIVVAPSGGVSTAAGSYVEHDTQRVDLLAFGPTPNEANALLRSARRAMTSIRRQIFSGCLIHWAEPAGGFSARRDGATQWPVAFQPYQVFHALQEVS